MNIRSVMTESRFRKILCPLTYALIFPVTLWLYLGVLYYAPAFVIESGFLFIGLSFFVFGITYFVFGTLLLHIERIARPGLRDHFRRSSLMYVGAVISIIALAIQPFPNSEGEDYFVFMLTGAMFLLVILIDASIVSATRLHSFISNYPRSARSIT